MSVIVEEKSRYEKFKDWLDEIFNSDDQNLTEEEKNVLSNLEETESSIDRLKRESDKKDVKEDSPLSNVEELVKVMRASMVFQAIPSLFPFGVIKTFGIAQEGNISTEGITEIDSYIVPEGKVLIFTNFDIPAFPYSENLDSVTYQDPEIPSIFIEVDGENIMRDNKDHNLGSDVNVKGMGIIPRGFNFLGIKPVKSGSNISIKFSQMAFGNDWSASHSVAWVITSLLLTNQEYGKLKEITEIF